MAAAGGEETSWKGGDGFSGGGGNGEGKGGSGGENGGDGRFTSGGVGSGLQVELLSTHSFALSVGIGGGKHVGAHWGRWRWGSSCQWEGAGEQQPILWPGKEDDDNRL